MKELYLEDLIQMFTQGCNCPYCTSKNNVYWIGTTCHTKSSIDVNFYDQVMVLTCHKCAQVILPIFYDSVTTVKKVDIVSPKEINITVFGKTQCPQKGCYSEKGFKIKLYNKKITLYCDICNSLVTSVTITKRKK